MANYEEYLNKLKGPAPELNEKAMRAGINSRLRRQSINNRLILSGAVMFFLFFGFYLGTHRDVFIGSDTIANYIQDTRDAGNNDAVMDYIFMEGE